MAVPQVIRQGQESIDMRLDTPVFRSAFFQWIASYPNGPETDEVVPVQESSKSLLPGVSRKQISQMIKHKNQLSKEQTDNIRGALNSMGDVDDPLVEKLRTAFA